MKAHMFSLAAKISARQFLTPAFGGLSRRLRALGGAPLWTAGEVVGLRQALPSLLPGDPEFADSIYRHRSTDDTLPAFSELSFLKHLMASEKTLHAVYAAGLLGNFKDRAQRKSFGRPAAKALMALTHEGAKLVAKVPAFAPTLFDLVNTQVKRVYAWKPRQGHEHCLRTAALLSAATAFEGLDDLFAPVGAELEASLSQTVLSDGGHVHRDGASLLELLALLMPLRQGLLLAKKNVPQGLHGAIERMLPMVRMMQHGNGEPAGFWADKSWATKIEAILAADHTVGHPLEFAPDAGVARLNDELLVLAQCNDARFELDVSCAEHRLLSVGIDTGRSAQTDTPQFDSSKDGRFLSLSTTGATSLTRDVFLAAGKADLRCEDQLPPEAFLQFRFTEKISILSVAPDKIRFMSPDQVLWIVAQRGGVFEQGTEYQNAIRLDPDAPALASSINWALRRDPRQ
jgi:hypothetical protein